jgi:pimeloyl-ACP methyl ester carboxylesterase
MTPSRVKVNGIELAVTTAGPPDGPMVLLLHGFPECAHGWSRQVGPLAEQGYFCVVPDQRGYATSDKPPRVADYAVGHLVADAEGLIDHFGRARCHVVSHDWGGVVGWTLAAERPERVASLTAMNIPHPRVFARFLRTPGQLARSWYIFALQLPWLPEWRMRRDGYDVLVRTMFTHTVHRPYSPEDLAAYREAWGQPGALEGMVNWYRAAARRPTLPRAARVTVPTLIVFGEQDRALDARMAALSAELCDDVRLELLPDAAHFVQHDAPDAVNRFLREFLGAHRGAGGTTPDCASVALRTDEHPILAGEGSGAPPPTPLSPR